MAAGICTIEKRWGTKQGMLSCGNAYILPAVVTADNFACGCAAFFCGLFLVIISSNGLGGCACAVAHKKAAVKTGTMIATFIIKRL